MSWQFFGLRSLRQNFFLTITCKISIFFSWSVRTNVDQIATDLAAPRFVKDHTRGVRLIAGSVYIEAANRLMHEGEWTCHVQNSLGSEKMRLNLVVTGMQIRKSPFVVLKNLHVALDLLFVS